MDTQIRRIIEARHYQREMTEFQKIRNQERANARVSNPYEAFFSFEKPKISVFGEKE